MSLTQQSFAPLFPLSSSSCTHYATVRNTIALTMINLKISKPRTQGYYMCVWLKNAHAVLLI